MSALGRRLHDAMEHVHSGPQAWPHPPALATCLEQAIAQRLDPGDRETLRAALARATRGGPGGNLIVAEDRPLGRVLAHGSVALYRANLAARLESRLLEIDPRGVVVAALDRDPRGELRAAWVSLGDGSGAGVLPGGAHHPLWGASDRLVRLAPGGSSTTVTLAGAVRWSAVDTIPPVAQPGRLPAGAGAALLNVLAGLARDQDRPALRYRGPYPTEQLFWSLTESFHFEPDPDPLARFLADAELTFARAAPVEAPVDWRPAPHERRLHPDGLLVQLRDGVERVVWEGRSYHRTQCQGLRRREHRVVRALETRDGPRHYVASLEALGVVVEDHLVLDDRGEPLERYPLAPDPARETPLAAPWREALGTLLPLEATPLLTGAIGAVWPEIRLEWGPVPGDLVETRGTTLRLSPRLARGYRVAHAAAAPGTRRALGQRLVREVLGLIGPAVRDAAVAWLDAGSPAWQEAELETAARRDRVALARAALAPLGRLLDALESGVALPE